MSLGQRLFELRKLKHLSQEEVAEKLNVTRQTISKWETDQSSPELDKIIPICELFEITTDELITGKKEVKEKRLDIEDNKKKRTIGLIIGILLYSISVVWIMISIPVLMIDPIVASAIFILICGVATCVLIYSRIMFKKEKKMEKKDKRYKHIEDILGLITLIIYLVISLNTMAWHLTGFIWVIAALVREIVKLILSFGGENNE